MDINYFGTVNAVRAIYPYMRDAHQGQIVMIASASGLFGTFGYCAYSPSKFAVRGLAESLRPEFKQLGINLPLYILLIPILRNCMKRSSLVLKRLKELLVR